MSIGDENKEMRRFFYAEPKEELTLIHSWAIPWVIGSIDLESNFQNRDFDEFTYFEVP